MAKDKRRKFYIHTGYEVVVVLADYYSINERTGNLTFYVGSWNTQLVASFNTWSFVNESGICI